MIRRAVRSHWLTGFVASACLWLSPPAALAQSADPADRAVVKAGPLGLTPGISIAAIGVDSNVFNERDDQRSDFVADIQPELDAWLRFGRLRIVGREQLNLMYFREYSSQSAINSMTSLRGELRLLWGTPYASVSYVKTNDRPDARVDTRAVSRSRPASVGVDLRLSSTTTLDVGADFNGIAFDEDATFAGTPVRNALARDTTNLFGRLRYTMTPDTALTVSVARFDEEFRFRPQQNSRSVRVLPGVAFGADGIITGSAEVGWLNFSPENTALPNFSGLISNVGLAYVLRGVTRFQVGATRDVRPSIDVLSTYALQTGLRGNVTHRASEQWDINLSGSRQRLNFGAIAGVVDPSNPTNEPDTVSTYGAGLGFYFNQGLRLGVRAESVRRGSPRPLLNYDNLRVLGSVTYTRR